MMKQRTEDPREVIIWVPARADGDEFRTHYLIGPDGSEKLVLDENEVPMNCPGSAILITVLPDGKLISDATEAAANKRAVELIRRFGLHPGCVTIRYEANRSYINMLWWSAINRLWLAETAEPEKPKKTPAKRRKKGE